jgi:hypothetical protein
MLPRMPWFAHPEAGHYNTDRVCETGKCRKGSPVRRAMPLAPKESSLNKFGEFPVVGVLWMVVRMVRPPDVIHLPAWSATR